jgi:site-specific recombinase XerD
VDFAQKFLSELYPVESELHPIHWTYPQTTARRAVKLMNAFAITGTTIQCRPSKTTGFDDETVALISKYGEWLEEKGYRNTTNRGHTSMARKFMQYIISIEKKPEGITEKDVVQYLNASNGYSHSTISSAIYSLKHFARFLFETGILKADIVPLFPEGHKYRLANIASVWKPGTVEKILEAVDRGSPIGKRDYAIILVAARLGLRITDIFGLHLDSIDWRNSRIQTSQNKTGQPITLPLPDDVGWALIDYMKNGRPQVDSPYVFLCHSKAAWGNQMKGTFNVRLAQYIRQARVSLSEGQKHGMHTLRHTLACRLLEAKTPLPVISEILGQISPDAIEKYLKVDVEMLRQCAINPQEVFANA